MAQATLNFEASYNFPVEQTWAEIADFGGWGKWFSPAKNLFIEGDGIDRVGCTRTIRSDATGILYSEKQLEKNDNTHTLVHLLTKREPATAFDDLTSNLQIVPNGEGRSKLVATITINFKNEVDKEAFEKFSTIGVTREIEKFQSLEAYLQAQNQQ